MDMHISGSGKIVAGEYENIKISGSGRLEGFVRCNSFKSSGSAHGEDIECREGFAVSGSGKFDKSIKAGSISVSGSLGCGGGMTASQRIKCSGSAKCDGGIKCGELAVSGSASAAGDIEAERVNVSGKLNCGGLLNAEEITIKFSHGMKIGSIGGSSIIICRSSDSKRVVRLPLLSSLVKSADGKVQVENAVEGDAIALEDVTAQRVSGRVVAIGAGCDIELVQYSEQLEVSPDAKIGKTEKI